MDIFCYFFEKVVFACYFCFLRLQLCFEVVSAISTSESPDSMLWSFLSSFRARLAEESEPFGFFTFLSQSRPLSLVKGSPALFLLVCEAGESPPPRISVENSSNSSSPATVHVARPSPSPAFAFWAIESYYVIVSDQIELHLNLCSILFIQRDFKNFLGWNLLRLRHNGQFCLRLRCT